MFTKKTIRDISVKGKIILVRVDYNVPLENGQVINDFRIKASLPTIRYLQEQGAKKIILISHLGRPDGKRVRSLSLKPVAACLEKLLQASDAHNSSADTPPSAQSRIKPAKELPQTVHFIDDVAGPDVEEAADSLKKGEILLLENLRFFPGEEKNSEDFIAEIIESVHAQIFVQDGFAVVHRAHASTSAVTNLLPSVAGLLLEKEISTLSAVMEKPKHPLALLIGGNKISDKQPLIDSFASLADHIFVVGKIAADGYTPAPSLANKVWVAPGFISNDSGQKLDIDSASASDLTARLKDVKTIIWNGLVGQVEDPAFAAGSGAIAEYIGHQTTAKSLTSIICGGDTVGFVEEYQKSFNAEHPALSDQLTYTLLSTGGGASLEFLCGEELPGIAALEDK